MGFRKRVIRPLHRDEDKVAVGVGKGVLGRGGEGGRQAERSGDFPTVTCREGTGASSL